MATWVEVGMELKQKCKDKRHWALKLRIILTGKKVF